MALQPDVDNPIYGYFVSAFYEEIILYVKRCVYLNQQSCVFNIHASGVFIKDTEFQEMHLPSLPPIILDPQQPENILEELICERILLCTDDELLENMDGSGWSLIPGTVRYWFKIYPCQPNEGAHPNSQNISEYDPDENDPPNTTRNTLLYSITEHYAILAGKIFPKLKSLKFLFLNRFAIETLGFTSDDFNIDFNLQDLPEWHWEVKLFNIRVWSLRGNLLYAKKFNENQGFIDLYINSNNKFSLIKNLYTLFKKKLERVFCMKCLKWGGPNHKCEKVLLSNKTDETFMPNIPLGRQGLTIYSDFESTIDKDLKHSCSGYGLVAITKNGIYSANSKNILQSNTLILDYLQEIINICRYFVLEEPTSFNEEICLICNEKIGELYVTGRNFINGEYGNHHLECWQIKYNSMYVLFHNFRGYDSHYLIKEIVQQCEVIGLNATSMEKFNLISIAVNNENEPLIRLTFKDTFNFFTCSLEKCISMIQDFKYTPNNMKGAKGTFPYDWFDDPQKMLETQLPPGPWYNKLTNTMIDPEPAYIEWEKNNFKTFAEFHDYYMMSDVYQLCDAFEEFRTSCINEFTIDPVHFQGAPSLTWHLGLQQNYDLFKIITDSEVYLDIQNNIRGGISQAMVRYINIEEKPEESLFFLDVNSLYSKCMTYKMPGKYLGRKESLPENWLSLYNENTKITALIKVDLYYPEHLHDRDWAYPLAPHKFNDRLCTTFKRKENYLIHVELLAFYLERGLVLEKVHYLYEFEQDYTLRDYVQNNIEKRRATKSEVLKTLYKLLNNSLYGKTCENVNKYRQFEVIKNETSQDNHKFNEDLSEASNFILFGENYLIEKPVKEVRLCKPIQIGFTILEFAKREIYKFLAIIQDHFGNKVIPLYTDTDSLLFWCDFPNPWQKFINSPLQPYLDFEKVPSWWNVKTHDTDKQSGLWSPEADGKQIVEYCGLRAKCYAYRFIDNEVVIKNKGIPKSAMISNQDETPRDKITIEHYKNALFTGEMYYITNYKILSKKHEITTSKQYKLGISGNDFKRAVTSNRAISLPFGYKGSIYAALTTDADCDLHLDT